MNIRTVVKLAEAGERKQAQGERSESMRTSDTALEIESREDINHC